MSVAAALAIGGCAGIPSSGPVERVAAESGLNQSTVRYAPVGPARGASPQQIVRGYLDAMLAYPVSTGVAATYLSPDAAQEWRSSAGVIVYARPEVTLPRAEPSGRDRTGVEVMLRSNQVARLDRQGHFTRSTDDPTRTYQLEQVKGEWRITNPQPGVMVTRTYFSDYFRPFPLYFFDAAGQRLVPDLVHLAVGDQLPTGLMTSLARGPSQTPGTLRSYVPSAGALRPSVTVGTGGVADVQFSTSLAKLEAGERDRLAAQIVWTLRSVPDLRGVRILGGTAVLTSKGERVHPIDSWGGFGPPAPDRYTYALVDDKLVEIDGATVSSVTGSWGRDAGGAVSAAVSEKSVAAVLGDRRQVRITDRAGRLQESIGGVGFIAPRWDRENRLWLVDRPSGTTRVRVVENQRVRVIAAAALAGMEVESVAISADGGRYAAAATRAGTTSLYVGPVRRDRDDNLIGFGDPRRLGIGVDDPHSVDWASPTRIGFLGGSGSGVQVYSVAIDGTDVSGGATGGGPLLPDVGATTLAGSTSPGAARWVVDARRRLWYLPPDGSWELVDKRAYSGLSTGG